jgi:hypothetical protein
MILIPLSIEKCIFASWFSATSVLSDPCTPTKSTLHFQISSTTALSELLTFQVPKSHNNFLSLGSFIQGIRPGPRLFWSFVTSLFFTMSCYPTSNPQTGGPPFVGCYLLLIQYIRSYRPSGGRLLQPHRRTLHALIFFLIRMVGGWVQSGSTRHVGHRMVYCTCSGWLWWWRIWWNEDWKENSKYSEKTCPNATSSTTNPTWPDPGSNSGRRVGKPATNRLSYGAAHAPCLSD